MQKTRISALLGLAVLSASCATSTPQADDKEDLGLLWVKHAAEFKALAVQAFRAAEEDLAGFIEDTSWSALPDQTDADGLPPAVILDVDETVVSNIDFQMTFQPPFANWKLDKWNRENKATAIPGVAAFVEKARAAGVTVFFVTNRPCEPEGEDPCTQRQTTIDDIAEAGIVTDADHVFLSDERGWNREKSTRRAHIARTHRVIMLFGDDLGDFIPCVRKKPYTPCTSSATAASRKADVDKHAALWGSGWYVLPNPMHGSWTGAH